MGRGGGRGAAAATLPGRAPDASSPKVRTGGRAAGSGKRAVVGCCRANEVPRAAGRVSHTREEAAVRGRRSEQARSARRLCGALRAAEQRDPQA